MAVVDWSGFSLRQGGALGAAALRNLIAALRGRFPARFKAIHFLSAPLYVQATLALVKPFLDEKTRSKVKTGRVTEQSTENYPTFALVSLVFSFRYRLKYRIIAYGIIKRMVRITT